MSGIILPELWPLILGNVKDTKDLKSLSLVCHQFCDLVKDHLWNEPKFKEGITAEQLVKLNHLPIKHIDTYDFGKIPGERRGSNVYNLIDAICSFSQLSSLKLGGNIDLSYNYIGKLKTIKQLKFLILEKLYAGVAKALSQLEGIPLETLLIEDLIFYSDIDPISKSVSKITTLKRLEIQTSDAGCRHLSKLSNLEDLIVRESELTSAGFKELAKIKSLKKIKFTYCEDAKDGVETFKKFANPDVVVKVEGDVEDFCDYGSYDDDDYNPYDYDESDLPPDFFDNYNELNLS